MEAKNPFFSMSSRQKAANATAASRKNVAYICGMAAREMQHTTKGCKQNSTELKPSRWHN